MTTTHFQPLVWNLILQDLYAHLNTMAAEDLRWEDVGGMQRLEELLYRRNFFCRDNSNHQVAKVPATVVRSVSLWVTTNNH